MKAHALHRILLDDFLGLEQTEEQFTAYRLAVDEEGDPREPIDLKILSLVEAEESDAIPSRLIERYLVEPFQRKYVLAQRWNPEGSRCFYSALERDTAIAEMKHHFRKRLLSRSISRAYYVKFSITFQGKVVDIHALVSRHPELVDENRHPGCHVVARAALDRGSDAIVTPSVRNKGGRCLAVYTKQALTPGEFLEKVVFARGSSGDVQTERNPYSNAERKATRPSDARRRSHRNPTTLREQKS